MVSDFRDFKEIRGQATDQLAGLLIVIIFKRLGLQMSKQLLTHICLNIDPKFMTIKNHDILQHSIDHIKQEQA